MNKLKSEENLNKSWKEWVSEFMFRIYFKTKFEDNRE
jgi:hypothetical protein